MRQDLIFQPVGVLAFLTLGVLLLIPLRRLAAGRAGLVKSDDFKFGESTTVPGAVSIPNRAMMNLLELPVLFYVASLMFFVSGKVDVFILALAWIYVGLRAGHTLIQLTYNNVMHRLIPYAASNLVLLGLWALLFIR